MAKGYSDEQWRHILELAHAALDVAKPERPAFLQSRSNDPEVTRQALELAEELEHPEADDQAEEEEEEPPRLIGMKFGRFVLTDYVGAGGAGEVYAARDTELGRTVAVKLLHPDMAGWHGAEERFVREARTASALNHPNIVTVHEILRTDGIVAIVMEYADGVPLRHRCGTPMPMAELLNVGQQIAQALAAAHAAGVVHRDIKPENIMIGPDGRIKVLDFGLARWNPGSDRNSWQSIQSVLPGGTVRYMSPEHYQGQPITIKSDLFAFGLVLYELSTGKHPFAGYPALQILHAIATETPEAPKRLRSDLPEPINALIVALLSKDQAQRPAAEVVAAALKECETAVMTGASVTSGKRTRSSGFAKGLVRAAVVAAVVVFGGAALMWKRSGTRAAFENLQQVTTLVAENRATAAAISADGRFAAYANVDGLFLRTLPGGEISALNGPRDFIVDHLAWLSDGTQVIASGFSEETNRPSIWSVSIVGAAPRLLRYDARFGVPSPDGTRIAFLSTDYSGIWTMALDGQDAKEVLKGPAEDTFTLVNWAREGRYLQVQRRHYSGKQDLGFVMSDRYYEHSLESVNADSGAIVGRLENVWVKSAVSLAGGRLLLLRSATPGANYSNGVWESKIDPGSGRFVGSLQKISTPFDRTDEHISHVSATADGQQLLVLREVAQNAVFVAEFDRAAIRFTQAKRLTLDDRASYPHAWTADSRSVIFESDRNGSYDLFRQQVDERVPKTIVATPKRWEVMPQLSPDGRYVLYAAGPPTGVPKPFTLLRTSVEGGVVEPVPMNGTLDEFRCSVLPAGKCVIRMTVDRSEYVYSHLDPVRGVGQELARTTWIPSVTGDWDISPDGKQIALPNHDSRSARVRVINLQPKANQPAQYEVDLPRLTNISGLSTLR